MEANLDLSLSEIADTDVEQLLADASPALRATLERCYSPQSLENPGGFNSFIDADL